MNEELMAQPPQPPVETPLKSEPTSVEGESNAPENISENTEASTVADTVARAELLAMTVAGAESDLTKIQGIEEKLGIKLPQATREKEASIDSLRDTSGLPSEVVSVKSPEEQAKTIDAAKDGFGEKEARLLEVMGLDMSKMTRSAKALQESMFRIDRTISNAQYSRGGFNIGRKLEEGNGFTDIKKQVRVLSESIHTLQQFPAMLTGNNSEKTLQENLAVQQFSLALRENQGGVQKLAKGMDAFFRYVSTLQQKIHDFHNGRGSEDEEALRKVSDQVRISFDYLKDLNRMCRDQELLLSDYQKIQQEKTVGS